MIFITMFGLRLLLIIPIPRIEPTVTSVVETGTLRYCRINEINTKILLSGVHVQPIDHKGFFRMCFLVLQLGYMLALLRWFCPHRLRL